jgi:hypothetical protein
MFPLFGTKKNDVWDTRKRCIEAHIKKGKKWSLTIQDDCLITDDFYKKIIKFISQHSKVGKRPRAFNFYFWNQSEQQVNRAMRRGYYEKVGMKSGLAICLPTKMLPDLLEYWKNRTDLERHDDSRIGVFLRNRQMKTVYPCPSFVQHRNSPSLIYKKGEMPESRQSICYEQK